MNEQERTAQAHKEHINCKNCGAELLFSPGAQQLKCNYCGTLNQIDVVEIDLEEIDYEKTISQLQNNTQDTSEVITITCTSCRAQTTFDPNIVSDKCSFCGTSLSVQEGSVHHIIKPKLLLPFKIEYQNAQHSFNRWLKKMWWAPNDLLRYASQKGKLNGVYIPYWTYDAQTISNYIGEKGTHYYETQRYSVMENGKSVTKTRQVQKTSWQPASGTISHFFDDILVPASIALPTKYVNQLEPWDLKNLVPYDAKFLKGFKAESYQLQLEEGYGVAKSKMDDFIRVLIRRDIGGDEQRIHTVNSTFDEVTFKHILLPIWISAYKYKDKTYRFLINGRTGEIQGERPYSWIKITLAILATLMLIAITVYIVDLFSK